MAEPRVAVSDEPEKTIIDRVILGTTRMATSWVGGTFIPVKGGWGRQGATNVLLKNVKEETLRGALTTAWQNASRQKSRKK
jgi:hypothetical protein